jgi:pimeloyl-ACP methyl ester carboxylesterase/ribosomal protein S18 acetylase RimI-like enzyme
MTDVAPFPAGFRTQDIATNGTTLYLRIGGQGPAAILLHGYGETGDMWAPLAAELARDHTVVVPDLRGMGRSARPESGYDKKTQGRDVAGMIDALGIERADLVTHDIGNMVGYAFAAQYPTRVARFVLMDAPLPGIGPWEEILKSPLLWHFRFGGPDMERLVAGRERIYLDRFWNEFSADPTSFSEAAREHYARLYAQPGAMHAGFSQFAAFDQDVIDNQAFVAQAKLTMPVLAIGGEKSFGPTMAVVMRAAATDVREVIIAASGHWLMEEQPVATVAAVRAFLDQPSRRMPETITLRPAVAADADAIRNLTREAYAKWVPLIGREPKPMTADYAAAVRNHRIDLLHVGDQLAALIETIPETDHLLIENVAVSPAFQHRGLGRHLLAHAEDLAGSLGYATIRLYTNKLFAANVQLYASLGYQLDREEILSLGTAVHMSKPIRGAAGPG